MKKSILLSALIAAGLAIGPLWRRRLTPTT